METSTKLTIKSALEAWNSYATRVDKLFDELSDEQMQKEVASGKNAGTYLLGHLAAVHDGMLPLLDFGEKLQPAMFDIFIKNPDKSGLEKPSIKELRNFWKQVNNKLSEHIKRLTPEEWMQKHTSIGEEDFKKEPHRNKLNVLINRTNHLAYHYGQLVFLK
jgi:uncharacterized damage-inducible protein DinB